MNNQIEGIFYKNSPIIVSFVFSFFFLLIMSFSTSPIYLNEGMDSCIFKTIGLAITKGKMMYVDIFDHKGPILFFINALGQYIGGKTGIFLLQVISLSLATFFWYHTAHFFLNSRNSVIALIVVYVLLMAFIAEGNQCEEWMLLYSSISMYISLKFFKRYQISHNLTLNSKDSILLGICFAMMFWIRPNDAFIYSAMTAMGICLFFIYKKSFRSVWRFILYYVVGILIVTIPIVAYFYYHNALCDLYYGTIGFNLSYVGASSYSFRSDLVLKRFIIYLPFLFYIVTQIKQRNPIIFIILPIVISSYLLTGWNPFNHYYIMLMPLYLLFLCVAIGYLQSALERKSFSSYSWAIASVLIFILSITLWKSDVLASSYVQGRNRVLALLSGQKRIYDFYAMSDRLLNLIPDNELNDVYNFNLRYSGNTPLDISPLSVFYHHNIVQCNPVTFAQDSLLKERNSIVNYIPKWVLTVNDSCVDVYDRDYQYLLSNYHMISIDEGFSNFSIKLWRKN